MLLVTVGERVKMDHINVHHDDAPMDNLFANVIEKAIGLFDVRRRRQEIELVKAVAVEFGAVIPYPSSLTVIVEDIDRYYEIFVEIAITHVHSKEDPSRCAAICLVPSKDYRLLIPNHQLLSRTSYTSLAIISNLLSGNLNLKVRTQVDHFIKTGHIIGPNLYFRKPFRPHPHMEYLFRQSPSSRDKGLLNIYLQTMNHANRHILNLLESPLVLEISPSLNSIHEIVEGFLEMVTNQEYELKLGHGRLDTARCYQLSPPEQ